MKKDFENYVVKRCEDELLKNNDYNELHKKLVEAYDNNDIETYSEIANEIQLLSACTSYRIATNDLIYQLID